MPFRFLEEMLRLGAVSLSQGSSKKVSRKLTRLRLLRSSPEATDTPRLHGSRRSMAQYHELYEARSGC